MIFHKHIYEEEDRQFGWSMRISPYGDRAFTLDDPADKLINPAKTLITLKCTKCPKRKEIFLSGHVHDKTPIPAAFMKENK